MSIFLLSFFPDGNINKTNVKENNNKQKNNIKKQIVKDKGMEELYKELEKNPFFLSF